MRSECQDGPVFVRAVALNPDGGGEVARSEIGFLSPAQLIFLIIKIAVLQVMERFLVKTL